MLFLESLSLPRTFAAWKAGESEERISDVLAVELQPEAVSMLGDVCSDDENIEILDLTFDEDRLRARFAIYFAELIPSGCADHPHRRDGRAEFLIIMHSDSVDALFQDNESDPNQWELRERNSAADGN